MEQENRRRRLLRENLFKDCKNIKEVETRIAELCLSNQQYAEEEIIYRAIAFVIMRETTKRRRE